MVIYYLLIHFYHICYDSQFPLHLMNSAAGGDGPDNYSATYSKFYPMKE